jgi:hypothetical protein
MRSGNWPESDASNSRLLRSVAFVTRDQSGGEAVRRARGVDFARPRRSARPLAHPTVFIAVGSCSEARIGSATCIRPPPLLPRRGSDSAGTPLDPWMELLRTDPGPRQEIASGHMVRCCASPGINSPRQGYGRLFLGAPTETWQ